MGQDVHNKMCKKIKKNQFSFPGPLHKEIYFSLHFLLQGAKERTRCSGMALIQLFGKHIILNMSSTHAVLHRAEKYDGVYPHGKMEALTAT